MRSAPHTTHILQPLYVVVFQPYKHYHTKAVDVAVRDDCTRFNKVEFLSAIGEIRRQTSTIKSAFRKTGIVPFNSSMALSQFQSPAESEPTIPSRSSTGRHNPDVLKTTPLNIRSLKRQSEFLHENAPQDDPEFTEVLDKFIRGLVLQSTEFLQSMRDLSRTRLTEKMRSERAMYVHMYVCTVTGKSHRQDAWRPQKCERSRTFIKLLDRRRNSTIRYSESGLLVLCMAPFCLSDWFQSGCVQRSASGS
jgi:hypothetical protein